LIRASTSNRPVANKEFDGDDLEDGPFAPAIARTAIGADAEIGGATPQGAAQAMLYFADHITYM
jgi:hypothetical protein